MDEVAAILNPGEQILYQGKPKTNVVVLRAFSAWIPGIIWNGIAGTMFWLVAADPNAPKFLLIFLAPFILIGIYILALPLLASIQARNTMYAVTDQRVIMRTGIIGRDFETINFKNISNAEVRVGAIDRMAGKSSGSVFFYVTGLAKPVVFESVPNPYDVFNLVKARSGW